MGGRSRSEPVQVGQRQADYQDGPDVGSESACDGDQQHAPVAGAPRSLLRRLGGLVVVHAGHGSRAPNSLDLTKGKHPGRTLLSTGPDQGQDTHQLGGLIHPELDEPEIT